MKVIAHFFSKPLFNLTLCAYLGLTNYAVAASPFNGPMLGSIEIREAKIWLQAHQSQSVRLVYWLATDASHKYWSETKVLHSDQEFSHVWTLQGLRAGSIYHYQIESNGKLLPTIYHFKTQTDWIKRSDPPNLKIALGSCVYLNDSQADPPGSNLGGDEQIFEKIAEQSPDLMIWMGDNVYLRPSDYYSQAAIGDRYRQLRQLPQLQKLMQTVAHYAIWDDHDYGDDNSDRSFRYRSQSLKAFQTYWANSTYGLPELPGIFGRFVWSDVEFFLTDNRSFRAPFKQSNPERDFFGEQQFQWLKDSLSSSTAKFKLIVLGNQTLNTQTPSENMYSYQREFKRFVDWLATSKIPGIVLLSGDRHHSELLKLERPGTYPLYEWTLSPLTSKAYAPFDSEKILPLRVEGSLLAERNFGVLEVIGPATARKLDLKEFDAQGALRWHYEIPFSDLNPTMP